MKLKKVLALTSCLGVAVAGIGLTSPAFALGANRLAFIAESGAVNCRGGDRCVEKIGDTAKVEWTVQTTPLISTSDNSIAVGQIIEIAVPKVVENVKLETVSLPDEAKYEEYTTNHSGELLTVPLKYISHEVRLVSDEEYRNTVKVLSEQAGKKVEYSVPNTIRAYAEDDEGKLLEDASGNLVEVNPDTWTAPFTQNEPRKSIEQLDSEWREYYELYDPFMEDYVSFYPIASHATNSENYNFIEVRAPGFGVSTFKVSGTVKVESQDTYVPLRVYKNKDSKCADFCHAVTDYLENLSGGALPEYSLTDADVNARVAKLQTDFDATGTDGRLGSPSCSPTSEVVHRNDILGWDREQPILSTREIGRHLLESLGTTPAAHPYTSYYIAAYDAPEDGCDQADFHITLCDEPDDTPENPDTPTSEEPNTPDKPSTGEPETPSTEKPTPTPVVKPVSNRVTASSQPGVVLADTGAHVAGIGVLAWLVILAGVAGIAVSRKKTTM